MSAHLVDRDKGWRLMFLRAMQAKGAKVKVGVLADDSKGGDSHDPKSGLTTAELAVILHFGTDEIPARPFLAAAFDEHREELAKIGKHLLVEVLEGEVDLSKALDIIGAKLATEAKKKITTGEGMPPPNAPSTIKRKGSSRPLVDTGRTLNAITWAQEKGQK